GEPRNAASTSLHGFLSRDGIAPAELLAIGRDQLREYDSVTLRSGRVVGSRRVDPGFLVTTEEGKQYASRMLLLATGVSDTLPSVPGVEEFYGRGVHHCPYCDGWEYRDGRLGVYGVDAFGVALEVRQWSRDIVLLADGSALPDRVRSRLRRADIRVEMRSVAGFEGNGRLQRVRFTDGEALERDAVFFKTHTAERSGLPRSLGCEMTANGLVKTGRFEITRIPGLFVAGDASRNVQLAIVAAAEGAQAAFAINTALMKGVR
ncbi:MAG TPA: NAD(P)/FAD-dependent oxidoreductase, partial [Rhodothermales bacterium]